MPGRRNPETKAIAESRREALAKRERRGPGGLLLEEILEGLARVGGARGAMRLDGR